MQAVLRKEIWDLQRYEAARPEVRSSIMRIKDERRMAVGKHVTLLFENHRTVWYQIQEMLRVEKITTDEGIEHEIQTYNELLAGPGELSATLLIEYPEPEQRDKALRDLVGLEKHFHLVVDGTRHTALFDDRQIDTDRLSSVQFIKLPTGDTSPDRWAELCAAGKVHIEIDHRALQEKTAIEGTLAQALTEDLRAAQGGSSEV